MLVKVEFCYEFGHVSFPSNSFHHIPLSIVPLTHIAYGWMTDQWHMHWLIIPYDVIMTSLWCTLTHVQYYDLDRVMCLSRTNISLYYINCSLLSLYSRLDISFNYSFRFVVSRTVTFCPPKRCDRGPSLLPLACRQHMFCVPGRDYPLYLVEHCSHDLVHHYTEVLIRLPSWTNHHTCRMIMPISKPWGLYQVLQ